MYIDKVKRGGSVYFEYGEKEITYLKKKDKRLGEAIDKIGMIKRPIDEDVFTAIIRAIIGQQVSRQARETVFKRMKDGIGGVCAINLNNLSVDEIQVCGTTFKKAGYIKELAQKVCTGELDLDELQNLPDKDVIDTLKKLNGIGVWTAEMLLASALRRGDVFSFGDIAIHRGLRMLYRHKEVTRQMFERYRKRYSPYGTVASVYLWAIAAGAIPEMDDPKNKKRVTKQSNTNIDYF